MAFVGALALVGLAGCSGDDQAATIADLEEQVAAMTAERDELQAQLDGAAARYDKVVAAKAEVEAVLADESAYDDIATMVDRLAAFATDGAQMEDDVFGSIGYRSAWFSTLSGDVEARIDTVRQWTDPDGSTSGSLWVWHGTNAQGNPFALIGVSVMTYDDDGLITHEWVGYPYTDEFVREAIRGAGTPTDATGTPWDEVAAADSGGA
ncbi:hypothetical protein [Demequina pelophila]|uniref:hypothetical protein n=1 Tax=Demequina pelophila TaxID=1638984 RepID=UPI000780FD79|nr:hypothetical protein [Demequina pelophila]